MQADGGSCVVYQAKFYLKNGSILNGSVEAAGFYAHNSLDANGKNPYCSNTGMLQLVKVLQREAYADQVGDGVRPQQKDLGKLPVYKNLHYLAPKPRQQQAGVYAETYGFLTETDVVFIDFNAVRQVVFISAALSSRTWYGSGIMAVSPGLIDTVRRLPFWNDLVVNLGDSKPDSLAFGGRNAMLMQGYRLINYNPQIDAEELERLARWKFNPYLKPAGLAAFYGQLGHPEQLDRKMQLLGRWFWQKGIVVVRINGTC